MSSEAQYLDPSDGRIYVLNPRRKVNGARYSGLAVARHFGLRVYALWLWYRLRLGPGVTVGEIA